jgi:ankyrin repeat protein
MQVTPAEFLYWGDKEGDTCLHICASSGNAKCIDIICRWTQQVESYSTVNKKGHTAAHIAANASVLKSLYENGANLWVPDSKSRYPLFFATFHNRVDCVAYLMELAIADERKHVFARARDVQGDSALHVAAIKGQLPCCVLLLFLLQNDQNNQGITPYQLATNAGFNHIASMVFIFISIPL